MTQKSQEEMIAIITTFCFTSLLPCLMIISTSFTMQCIGHSLLESRRFYRMIGGTIACVGMFIPLTFVRVNLTS
ncbi:MAG: hypothetical protein ACMG6E_08975, partial [Candidatus Roizmanbacteria bacterium]